MDEITPHERLKIAQADFKRTKALKAYWRERYDFYHGDVDDMLYGEVMRNRRECSAVLMQLNRELKHLKTIINRCKHILERHNYLRGDQPHD